MPENIGLKIQTPNGQLGLWRRAAAILGMIRVIATQTCKLFP
jgi:hypothetical protein